MEVFPLKTSRMYCCCAGLRVREVLRGRLEDSPLSATGWREECSWVLGSSAEASTFVPGVPDVLPLEHAGGGVVGGSFSWGDPSSDDDESSESGDGGSELESDSSVCARFAFSGAYRADNMPSTTLRNFNGWGSFGGLGSEGA